MCVCIYIYAQELHVNSIPFRNALYRLWLRLLTLFYIIFILEEYFPFLVFFFVVEDYKTMIYQIKLTTNYKIDKQYLKSATMSNRAYN
jgi:hypothetical protein